MSPGTATALSFGLLATVAGLWLAHGTGDGDAAGQFRLLVPGLSGGAPALATPTPTPTPPGGGGGGVGGSTLEIFVSLEITGREPSVEGDGKVDIPILAEAVAPLLGPTGPPVTVTGTATIAPHPADAAGCTWSRTYAATAFRMTVFSPVPGSNDVLLAFEAPEWHYTVTCPTDPPFSIRVPAFGEQAMLAFVEYTFPEYVPPDGIPLAVAPVSTLPACIKREATFQRTSLLADATLHVVIYEPPCALP